MRIDAYTHFIPEKFFAKIVESHHPDIGKRVREIPCIHDLDARKKVVDTFPDYAQILSYPMPPVEILAKGEQINEYAKLINDGFADICKKDPDHFPGWVAEAPIGAPDAGARECERAIKSGALGVQIHTNIAGKPLDLPEFAPFWETMNRLGKPVWLHPARAANFPDYLTEQKSKYEIWWTFGWSYETAAAMARLVFSKIMDKYPNLKIITHHFGGIVPMLEGRIGPGWDQLGARTSDEDLHALLGELKKRPLDYFKHSFYADTAVFGGEPATQCGAGLLRPRQDRVRLRLPVRSGKGHHVHARDAAHSRGHRHAEGRQGEDLARQSGAHHGGEIQDCRFRFEPLRACVLRGCLQGAVKLRAVDKPSMPGWVHHAWRKGRLCTPTRRDAVARLARRERRPGAKLPQQPRQLGHRRLGRLIQALAGVDHRHVMAARAQGQRRRTAGRPSPDDGDLDVQRVTAPLRSDRRSSPSRISACPSLLAFARSAPGRFLRLRC